MNLVGAVRFPYLELTRWFKSPWWVRRWLVRLLHSLVILSMLLSNLAMSITAYAANDDHSGTLNTASTAGGYSPPVFEHPQPRMRTDSVQDLTVSPASSSLIDVALRVISPARSASGAERLQPPADEPFAILESHPEFAHPWIQNEDFSTNCPLGMVPAERYGVCEATFTFYNGSGFTISEYGGYDLLVGYVDPSWQNSQPTYYTSITEICRVGIFNRVESCLHQPVIQNEVFKAQNDRFPIGSHQRITMTKTIFWSLDPDVWWNDPRSSESSCTNKSTATDARECPWCNASRSQGYASDPINSLTGTLDYQVRDLSLSTPSGPLSFSRCYTSSDPEAVDLGYGWVHNHNSSLTFPSDPDGEKGVVWFRAHCANQYAFIDHEDGTYTAAPGVPGTLVENAGPPVTYTVRNELGSEYTFNDAGRLIEWADAEGRTWSYDYDTSDRLERVTDDTSGRYLEFTYDGSDRLIGVADPTGRGVSFAYDGSGDLVSLTDVLGGIWTYTYDGEHRLTEVIDPRAVTEVRTEYDGEGRAVRQYNGENELLVEITFNADSTANLTDALGNTQVHAYDSRGALVEVTDALGGVSAHTYGGNNKQTAVSDPMGHLTQMTWGSQGVDLLQVIDAAGYTTDFSYDTAHHLTEIVDTRGYVNAFSYAGNMLASATDALGGIQTYTYFPDGYLETVADALGRVMTFTYDSAGQPVSMTDALGNTWGYSYDALGRLVEATDPLGRITRWTYDESDRIVVLTSNFNPAKSQNEDGQWNIISEYGYDALGNLITITDTLGRLTTFVYDDANRLTGIQDSLGNTTQYAYDAAGELILLTDAMGRITTYTYDANHRLESATDALGNVFGLSYNPDATIANVVDALGRTSTYAYDALGRLASYADPLGSITSFSYDPAGNLIGVTDARGYTSSYNYDGLNRLILETDALGNVTEHFYDAVGNRIQTIDANGHPTTFSYDSLNRLVSITDPLGHSTIFAYDALGNLLSSTDPLGNSTTYGYDGLNRRTQVINPLGHVSMFGYDALGHLVSFIDAKGVESHYEYDNLARLTAVVENYLEGEAFDVETNVRTEYSYDAVGNLLTNNDAYGRVTSYSYDLLNRLVSVTSPLGHITDFEYDAVGSRIGTTDALGLLTSYSYDGADRLVGIDYPTPDADVTFNYDPAGNLESMSDGFGTTAWVYDARNQITQVVDPFGTEIDYEYDATGNRLSLEFGGKSTAYSYDAANRLVELSDWAAGATAYAYDPSDQLQSISRPNGVNSEYQYDAAGQLSSLTHDAGGTALAEYQYSYDPVGNLTQAIESITEARTYLFLPLLLNDVGGASSSAAVEMQENATPTATHTPTLTATPEAIPTSTGTPAYTVTPSVTPLDPSWTPTGTSTPTPMGTTTQVLSPDDWPSSTPTPAMDTEPVSVSGIAQPSGRGRAALAAPPQAQPASGLSSPQADSISRTIDYAYDPLNRLISADYSSGEFYHYLYEATGNRLAAEGNAGLSFYSYDGDQRITSVNGTPYSWDDKGQLLGDGEWTYAYDHAGRLVGASDGSSTQTIGYNGLGDRIWLEQDGVGSELTLDLNQPLAQVLSDGSTDYLFGAGRAGEAQEGGWLYGLPDGLGSLRQGTNTSGQVTLSRSFTPFGVLTDEIAFQSSQIGFTGEWSDPTGLLYLRARYYAPAQGRFTTRDPFSGIASFPATLHPYTYALNNPLAYTDPNGEFPALIAAALLAGAISGLFEYGSQVHHNMANCGMSFWDATYYQNLDASRLGLAFVEGAVLGGLGYLTGGLIAASGLTGLSAFAVGGVIDVSAGMIWDMAVRGYTPSEAFVSNLVAFGVGEVIGYAARRAVRSIGHALSTYRLPVEGESFIRYESGNPAFTKVTAEGGTWPGTYAAPMSEGVLPQGELAEIYNLPSPDIPRTEYYIITPAQSDWVIGPKPVSGGTGAEVVFPHGTSPWTVTGPYPVPAE